MTPIETMRKAVQKARRFTDEAVIRTSFQCRPMQITVESERAEQDALTTALLTEYDRLRERVERMEKVVEIANKMLPQYYSHQMLHSLTLDQ